MAIQKPKLDPLPTKSTKPSATSSSTFLLPSPPSSPKSRKRRLPKVVVVGGGGGAIKPPSPLRRRGTTYLLALPLLYFCGVLMCVGPFSSLLASRRPVPGSFYRSHVVFDSMWPHLVNSSSSVQLQTLWTYKRRLKEQKHCQNPSDGRQFAEAFEANQTSGYLIVEANGGLNQQRSAICNAVAVAAILNAILVIPQFEFNEVWKDPSKFEDIYDEDHFISTLDGYVKVVRQLPQSLMEKYVGNETNMPNLRVPAWATVKYYLSEVYPILRMHGVIQLAPFANRLSMNVPPHVQFLRCLTNFKALKFSSSILTLADRLVGRMKERSSRTSGKYTSIHLRFEEDMVAFSCCVYDGGETERAELETIRQRRWRGKFKRKDRVINPSLNRIEGKCPMTPLEVGMMLRGMGFDNGTSIYLASGKVYHADRYLAPLLKMFPFIYTKESLANPDELSPFEGYSSRLAALDYMVCLHSEAFVTTQGGNFPHFLMGQRRFIFDGHSKTIKPDKQKLALLLQDGLRWEDFKIQMEKMLMENDHKASVIPRVKKFNRKTSIYAFPFPECRCLHSSQNSSLRSTPDLDSHDHSRLSSNR